MFEDFLSLEKMRMDELKYRFTTVRLNILIKKALENFRIKHGRRKVELLNELAPGQSDRVTGDFDKLLQVLNNILNNAAKFSHSSSTVTIRLSDTKAKQLIITIEDRGLGIDKKDIGKIFQKYYTTKIKNKEGMGIGMYLTKKIIEKHKGQIRVRSEKGKGTAVSIVIPRTK
jgi:signal transduction histidine kinase